ncbi:MATE family efflux transporter [Mycoplasmopsis lipofaciens]|uniref:MATE family efflux transporter n=1 Tax=Mycoplasmopsis lipofaciens TaxID=114884 RepID=UPI0004844578|nr:MATE family efflux transporter [Mycoplasmopsis lipofaciens]
MDKKQAKQERAELLFGKTPIKKAIWIVAIPSLMSAMMVGLYTFVDQVFIQNFVPRNTFIFDDLILGRHGQIYDYLSSGIAKLNEQEYKILFDNYNGLGGQQIAYLTPNSVVSSTSVAFQPLIIFSNSVVFLIPVGASVYYTKCVSKNLEKSGRDLWATMFWCTAIVSLFATLMSFIFVWSGLIKMFAGHSILDVKPGFSEHETLQAYYDASYKMVINWASKYVYIYAAGTIMQGISLLLSYFIRAEGYNSYVMFWGILANVVNILFDAIFIIPLKLGVLGGVLATLIGWAINLIAYLIYIIYHERKNKTWLSLSYLFKFKFNKKLLGPTILLGFSGFIRTFGVAVTFAIMNILLSKTAFASPLHYLFYWSKSMPILALFLTSIFGINDGARSLMSYNYTRRQFDRCKQVYLWTMLVAICYSLLTYTFILLTSSNLLVTVLNVTSDMKSETAKFMKIITLRLVAISLSISCLLAFQGTNDVEKSIVSSMMESFFCFSIIIPIGYGVAAAIFKSTGSVDIANTIIIWFFVINSLIASVILMGYSYWYIIKKLPKIDSLKLSWSRKIEHKFFERAEKAEIEYKKEIEQKNQIYN